MRNTSIDRVIAGFLIGGALFSGALILAGLSAPGGGLGPPAVHARVWPGQLGARQPMTSPTVTVSPTPALTPTASLTPTATLTVTQTVTPTMPPTEPPATFTPGPTATPWPVHLPVSRRDEPCTPLERYADVMFAGGRLQLHGNNHDGKTAAKWPATWCTRWWTA